MKTDLLPRHEFAANDVELADRVRHFASARVLVLGDVILDRYVTGSAQRLSPEAPIPVLRRRPTGADARRGGERGAEHRHARRPGLLVGVVGDDAAGIEMTRLVQARRGVHRLPSSVAPDRPTTAKTRFMAGSHQLLRLDEETTGPWRRRPPRRCWRASRRRSTGPTLSCCRTMRRGC